MSLLFFVLFCFTRTYFFLQRFPKKRSNGVYHRKNDSIASTASSSSGSQFYEADSSGTGLSTSATLATGTPIKPAAADSFSTEDMAHTPDKDEEDGLGFSNSLGGAGSHGGSGRWSSAQSSAASNNGGASVDSCSNMVSSEPKPSSCPSEARLPKLSSRSEGSNPSARLSKTSSTSHSSLTKPTPESPYKTSEFYIIRVSIEASGPETEGNTKKLLILDFVLKTEAACVLIYMSAFIIQKKNLVHTHAI